MGAGYNDKNGKEHEDDAINGFCIAYLYVPGYIFDTTDSR